MDQRCNSHRARASLVALLPRHARDCHPLASFHPSECHYRESYPIPCLDPRFFLQDDLVIFLYHPSARRASTNQGESQPPNSGPSHTLFSLLSFIQNIPRPPATPDLMHSADARPIGSHAISPLRPHLPGVAQSSAIPAQLERMDAF